MTVACFTNLLLSDHLQAVLKLLFKRFVDVLTERLPPVSADGEIPNLRAGDQNVNSEARDLEKATMEIDSENGADKNRSVSCSVCATFISITSCLLLLALGFLFTVLSSCICCFAILLMISISVNILSDNGQNLDVE